MSPSSLSSLGAALVLASCHTRPPPLPTRGAVADAGTIAPVPSALLPFPPPHAATASVHGRVLFGSQPLAGVEVTICSRPLWYGVPCSGEGRTTKTDALGRYALDDLPLPKDGWQSLGAIAFDGLSGPDFTLRGVEAGRDVVVDIHVMKHDVKILAPAKQSRITSPQPTLEWAPYPGAATYELLVSHVVGELPAESVRTPETSVRWPKPLVDSTYLLQVKAFDAHGTPLADNKGSRDTGWVFAVSAAPAK